MSFCEIWEITWQRICNSVCCDRFLLQCLEDLDCSLRKLNSRLFVIRGQPADALPKLFKEWGTTNLTFEEDPEPFGRVRDHNISALCKELGISVVQRVSHTLYKLDEWVSSKVLLLFEQLEVASLSNLLFFSKPTDGDRRYVPFVYPEDRFNNICNVKGSHDWYQTSLRRTSHWCGKWTIVDVDYFYCMTSLVASTRFLFESKCLSTDSYYLYWINFS